MYTSYIGKKFLNIYRQRKNLPGNYSARQFFDEVLFPLFFDNEKFFMSVHSSPFDQLMAENGAKFKKHKKENPNVPFVSLNKIREHRVQKLNELHEKIANGEIGGNTAVGYYSLDIEATSSGQITSMKNTVTSADMYASWIGHALSIRIDGGLILIDDETVLLTLFNGWIYYREFLTKTPRIKDKQIEAWNGHWLAHSFGKSFDKDNVWAGFYIDLSEAKDAKSKSIVLRIPSLDWVNVVFAMTNKLANQIVTAYGYNLSKTNTTYGFINIILPKVRRLIRLKEQLYTLSDDGQFDRDFEHMYSTFYNFKNACKLGVIGLKTLEPKGLRDFMPKGTEMYAKGNDYKFTNTALKIKTNESALEFEERFQKANRKRKEEVINFQIFKTWIIAMLNNKKELNALAEEVAQALVDFEEKVRSSEAGRGKSTQNRLSEEVKSSRSLKEFIEKLTDLMAKHKQGAEVFKKVKDTVIELPADLFPLFVTLIRFEYQFKKSIYSSSKSDKI